AEVEGGPPAPPRLGRIDRAKEFIEAFDGIGVREDQGNREGRASSDNQVVQAAAQYPRLSFALLITRRQQPRQRDRQNQAVQRALVAHALARFDQGQTLV